MVALKVTLPHLPSLSRHSSPSRPTTPQEDQTGVTQQQQRTTTQGGGGIGAALRRSTSGRTPSSLTPPTSRLPSDSSTLNPLRRTQVLAAPSSSSQQRRAQSSDRRLLPTKAAVSGPTTSLQQSSSQPPLSRTGAASATATPSQHHGTGKRSPILAASGANTPAGPGGGRATPTLHNLEESYVGKVSLRLGEAVNRVFLADSKAGPAEVSFKGRAAPKVDRTKEVGEVVIHELQAALHDVYLLRTLLRSSVLKSLSLFLTRLTALLLPSDAVGPPPFTLKEADSLSPALKFNLQIVRCAYELKHALHLAGRGAPSFVKDTLRPWTDKLNEVMNRVMNPLITSVRIAVSLICDKALVPETAAETAAFALAHPTPVHGATALKQGGAQLRSLSMGRVHSPALGGAGGAAGSGGGSTGLEQGPTWLRELCAVLDATVRLISRLDCGADADKWLVSVGTHAVWKGMLSLSARRIASSDDRPSSSLFESASTTPAATPSTASHKPFFSTSITTKKRSPSPGDSPPLHPIGYSSPAALSSPSLRLLAELELFESRLIHFSSSLSTPPAGVEAHVLMSGTCADVASCGLCKTGRQFDAESSDDEDETEPLGGLAQYAMREAMQALSAMVVVVRASRRVEVLKMALEHCEDEREDEQQQQKAAVECNVKEVLKGADKGQGDSKIVPLTPMALMNGQVPSLPSSSPTPASSTTISTTTTAVAPTPLICPTLHHALDTLPTLILLHLLASRLPSYFRLPHSLWGIDWRAYEKEIRGFASGEEWTPEVAWEMAGEVGRCEEEREVPEQGGERLRMDCLVLAIRRKAGVEVLGA